MLSSSLLLLWLLPFGLESRFGLPGGERACIKRPLPSFHIVDCAGRQTKRDNALLIMSLLNFSDVREDTHIDYMYMNVAKACTKNKRHNTMHYWIKNLFISLIFFSYQKQCAVEK